MDPRRLAVAIACSLVVAGAVLAARARTALTRACPDAEGMRQAAHRQPAAAIRPPGEFLVTSPARLRTLGDPARNDELALGLTAAEYNAGHVAAARRDLELAAGRLGDEDVRVSVGSAMLGWSPARSTDVARTLEGIASDAPSRDGFPLVERGLVSLWQGCTADAASWFAQARAAAPDGFYGVLADNLLHPNQNQEYPPFFASQPLPGGTPQLRDELRPHTRTRRGSRWPTRSRCRMPDGEPMRVPPPSRRSPTTRTRSTRRSPRSCSGTTRTRLPPRSGRSAC